MPEWLIVAAVVAILLLAKLADRRSDIRWKKALEEADARDKARRLDWVDKRHNCRATSVLVDLEWDAQLIVQTRAEQLEGSGEPLPECDGHREDPGFYVKREGGCVVSFGLGCFLKREGQLLTMRVSPPDEEGGSQTRYIGVSTCVLAAIVPACWCWRRMMSFRDPERTLPSKLRHSTRFAARS